MREYLISTEAGTLPSLQPERFERVLAPRGFASEPVPGSGDYRLRIDGAEVAFFAEEDGWHVVFDGPPTDDEVRLLNVLQRQLETEVSAICRWTQVG